MYFFECLYFSEYNTRVSLYNFWMRKSPLIKYVCNWWVNGESSKMRSAAYREKGSQVSCVRMHVHYLFSFFWRHFLALFVGIQPCIYSKKNVFVKTGYFSPARSISVVMKYLYVKLFLKTKLIQNAFDFNKIEYQVYSIFQYNTFL